MGRRATRGSLSYHDKSGKDSTGGQEPGSEVGDIELVACLADAAGPVNLAGPADATSVGAFVANNRKIFPPCILILSISRIIFLLILGIDKRHSAAASVLTIGKLCILRHHHI